MKQNKILKSPKFWNEGSRKESSRNNPVTPLIDIILESIQNRNCMDQIKPQQFQLDNFFTLSFPHLGEIKRVIYVLKRKEVN